MTEPICISVEGITVSGLVTRSKYQLSVEITHPYQNLKDHAPHIPHFARNISSWEGEKGDWMERKLLEQLFRAGRILAAHQATGILTLHPKLQSAHEQEEQKKPALLAERSTLRKKFRHNELTQNEYQAALNVLKEQTWAISRAQSGIRHRQTRLLRRKARNIDPLYDGRGDFLLQAIESGLDITPDKSPVAHNKTRP